MKKWMGVDIGDATIKAAVYEPTTWEFARVEGVEAGVISAVAFEPKGSGGVLVGEPVFPAADNFLATHPKAMAFQGLKGILPALRTREEVGALMVPVFEVLRQGVKADEVALSLVIPADYRAELCAELLSAARRAGFVDCSYVHELTAAILACVPEWRRHREAWDGVAEGRLIWVFDSGAGHLNAGLVRVERDGDELSMVHMAGDRMEESVLADDGDRLIPRLEHVMAEMESHVDESVVLRWTWAVAAGGGAWADKAVAYVVERGGWDAGRRMSPPQRLACGAAVHAAMLAGSTKFNVKRLEARRVLGVRVEMPPATTFVPLTSLGTEPPYDFEGAFRLDEGDGPVEVTLAAALPGGQRAAEMLTFVVGPEELLREAEPAGVLIRGRLENWVHGSLAVRDLQSGLVLRESAFQLP